MNTNLSSDKFRTLYLSKLEKSPERARILTEINEEFTNANKYLNSNTKMIFGHKPISIRDIVIEKKEDFYRGMKKHTKKATNKELIQVKPVDKFFDNYEPIDSNAIKDLFETYRSRHNKKSSFQNLKFPPLPKEVSSKLELQEKTLAHKINDDNDKEKMSKYLCAKIKKKNNELLMNSIEKFRIKKEVVNTFHYKNSLEDRYEKLKWKISLRRPEHFKGARKIFVNVSSDANPLWTLVKDKYTKKDKIYCYSNDLDEIEMNQKLKKKDLNQIQKNIKTITSLRLNGKSLLQFEFDHAMNSKGQKYIKRNVENKEQKRNSNETFCEHYNISNQKRALTMSSFNISNQTLSRTAKRTQDLF